MTQKIKLLELHILHTLLASIIAELKFGFQSCHRDLIVIVINQNLEFRDSESPNNIILLV